MEIILQKSHQKSFILLSRHLCNIGLEQLFMGLWSDSAVDATVTLSSVFATDSRVYLQSVSSLSLLSVDALNDLLSSESFLFDSEDALLQILFTHRHPSLLRHIRWEFVSTAAIASPYEDPALFHPTESLWLAVADRLLPPPPPPAPEIDSLIVSEFPLLFEEFRAKRFKLLWRGSRDGFGAKKFHHRCDGRANTLTLISNTDGNVFGGFTPVKWESRAVTSRLDKGKSLKGDASLRSFLFTLRNPRGGTPRKFALRADRKEYAIDCNSACGPSFGASDMLVSDNCNANRNSSTGFRARWSDRTYANDIAFWDFFAGAHDFTVTEIEVFQIAD
jgi:hypothetical protein